MITLKEMRMFSTKQTKHILHPINKKQKVTHTVGGRHLLQNPELFMMCI